jgi:hypothetical protein
MRSLAMAALTAIHMVPITRDLAPQALQGAEPRARQSSHDSGPCHSRHGGIEDLQGLGVILWRGQSHSSSPQ